MSSHIAAAQVAHTTLHVRYDCISIYSCLHRQDGNLIINRNLLEFTRALVSASACGFRQNLKLRMAYPHGVGDFMLKFFYLLAYSALLMNSRYIIIKWSDRKTSVLVTCIIIIHTTHALRYILCFLFHSPSM